MMLSHNLAKSLPNYRKTGWFSGVITIGDDAAPVATPIFGITSLHVKTMDTSHSWTWIGRATQKYVPTLITAKIERIELGDFKILTTDRTLVEAWLDEPIREALLRPNASMPAVLTDARVELQYPRNIRPGRRAVEQSLLVAATVATRPARLAREIIAATAHYPGVEVSGAAWDFTSFGVTIPRGNATIRLDWLRRLPGEDFALARLRTRARLTVTDATLTLDAIRAAHADRIAALGDAELQRGTDHVAVVHRGVPLDRETLDATVDLLAAIAR